MDLSKRLIRLVENLLILGLVAMVALVFGNVVMRYGFDSGVIQAEEVSRVIFVWLTFGGAFLVARQGGHLGMTSVVAALSPRGQKTCRFVSEIFSLFCVGLVILGAWRQIVINIDNYAPITGIPLAVTFMAAFAGCLGMAALNLMSLFRLISGRMRPEEYVIGVESEELAKADTRSSEKRP